MRTTKNTNDTKESRKVKQRWSLLISTFDAPRFRPGEPGVSTPGWGVELQTQRVSLNLRAHDMERRSGDNGRRIRPANRGLHPVRCHSEVTRTMAQAAQ